MSETDPITIWAPDTIFQTTIDRLEDLIRAAGIDYLKTHPNAPWLSIPWRDKPWHDGVMVDLDESDVVAHMARFIASRANPDTPPEGNP